MRTTSSSARITVPIVYLSGPTTLPSGVESVADVKARYRPVIDDLSVRIRALASAGRPEFSMTEQLERYFAGELRKFELRLNPRGTEFQRSVWQALCDVPWGQTTTYGEIARRA